MQQTHATTITTLLRLTYSLLRFPLCVDDFPNFPFGGIWKDTLEGIFCPVLMSMVESEIIIIARKARNVVCIYQYLNLNLNMSVCIVFCM